MIVLYDAIQKLMKEGIVTEDPIRHFVSAISVGLVDNQVVLDLDYIEDSGADVDLNLVMTDAGSFIEIQGTAEKDPFSNEHLSQFIEIGKKGIDTIMEQVKETVAVSA